MARVRGYQRASKAGATVRAHRADAALFDAWCVRHELQAVPADPATIAAFLVLGFSAALRRSELVALDVADLVLDRDGPRLIIRRSKTDQESAGQEIAVPHGRHLKPVEAVRNWLTAAGITAGPVFRPVSRASTVRGARLTDQSITTS
jgi:integrase